jgi:hypothetical protein
MYQIQPFSQESQSGRISQTRQKGTQHLALTDILNIMFFQDRVVNLIVGGITALSVAVSSTFLN